jgi:hypothetical protein
MRVHTKPLQIQQAASLVQLESTTEARLKLFVRIVQVATSFN